MILTIEPNSWQYMLIRRMEKDFDKSFLIETSGSYYINTNDLFKLILMLEKEVNFAADTLSEFSNILGGGK